MINGAELIRFLYAKVNLHLHLAPEIKINPQLVIDLNVKPNTVKLLEANIGENHYDLGVGNDSVVTKLKA